MNMVPRSELVHEKFEMNMTPKKTESDSNYDGPSMEQIDTQKVDNNYSITV